MGRIEVRYFVKKSYFNKKLGKVVTYYYWQPKRQYFIMGKWHKCPLKPQQLNNDPIKAHSEAEGLNNQLDLWRSGIKPEIAPKEGSFDWLLCEYKKSDLYRSLGDRTAKEYGYIIEAIRLKLRVLKVQHTKATAWTPQIAYRLYESFLDTPRKAQLVVAISRIVFNYALKKIEGIKINPFDKLGIKKNKPRQQIWLDLDGDDLFVHVDLMKKTALEMGLPSIALAIDLGLWTTQRENDLLALPWNKYDGKVIKLRQKKTGVWVEIPVMPQLRQGLDRAHRNNALMLISERTGKSYSKDHFGDIFREVRIKAGLSDNFQFRDFRRTSIVLMAMAGCTVPEITAISGHTNAEVTDILETYMPRNSHMARNAVDKMQNVYVMQLEKAPVAGQNGVGK